MELPQGKPQLRREFWIQHIEAAERFDGTIKEYCQRQGLKPGTLNTYRKKLGYAKPRSKKSKPSVPQSFVPVKLSESNFSVHGEPLNLPDPNWLAQFLMAWGSQ